METRFLPSNAVASVAPHLVRKMLIVNSAVTHSSESLWLCVCSWECVLAFVFSLHCLLVHILLPILQVFHLKTRWDFLSHPGDVSLGWLKAIVPTQLQLLPWVCSCVFRITGLVLFPDTFVTTEYLCSEVCLQREFSDKCQVGLPFDQQFRRDRCQSLQYVFP